MHKQEIYYGAPGTGKSHAIDEMLKDVNSSKIFRVTIHPEYTYSDFVGQLLPAKTESRTLFFEFKAGPFTRALREAYADQSTDVYLVLEELSRGNVAAIFGDIFQLLDRNKYFVSKYPIRNKDVADQIPTLLTDEVVLPSNFSILCTVNTNDQNVFPMDTAFKRRFDWIYVSTRPALNEAGEVDARLNNPKMVVSTDDNLNTLEMTWQSFYTSLNKFITDKEFGMGRNEDRQVGQFFINFGEENTMNSYSDIDEIAKRASINVTTLIKNKLLQYLWQDVQGTSSFGTNTVLFSPTITSFDDLYSKYGTEQVFSDEFIEKFLRPNKDQYLFK